MMKTRLILFVTMLTLAASAAPAQNPQRGAAAPPRPAPRWPDGRLNLGALPGETGLWAPAGIVQLSLNPNSVNRAGANTHLPNNIKIEDVPFQLWARALHAAREAAFESDEPHTRCKSYGGARQFVTPYGVEFVDFPEMNLVYIFDIGGPHTFRTIYMDGRPHPKDLQPSFYGHSTGTWDKDTLVVDTVGFNEKFWIDRGQAPHTEKLHLIEKFTRTDMNNMTYELTVEDPGAYSAIWSRSSAMTFRAGNELFEYVCQDNNFAPELLVGSELNKVDRSSQIVP